MQLDIERFENMFNKIYREAQQQFENGNTPTEEAGVRYEIASDKTIEEKNIFNGKKAIKTLMQQAKDNPNSKDLTITNAMYRTDIGNIDFVWGVEGTGEKFKKGYGLSHIIAKRNFENNNGLQIANKLVEVIAKATEVETQTSLQGTKNNRIKLKFDGYTAVLSQSENGNHWLLTGWEDNKKETKPYAVGEVRDSSNATADETTLTRLNRGKDFVSTTNIPSTEENVNTQNSIPENKADAEYMSAVENGDMQTAQRLVDEAAKEAGYDYHLYHGTNADFTKFDLRKHGGKNGKGEGLFGEVVKIKPYRTKTHIC